MYKRQAEWRGATIGDLIKAQLKAFAVQDRLSVAGPVITLQPNAVQYLGIAFHELATNAAKYGALSGTQGRVELTWREASGALQFDWKEVGGPLVTPPPTRGFGSRLLTQGLAVDLGAPAELSFEPSGLRCRLSAPLV